MDCWIGLMGWWLTGGAARMLPEDLVGNLGEALAGGVMFEAAAENVFRPERTVQSQLADGAGDVVGAAQNPAVDQNARADTRADGQKDGIAAAFGDATPRLAQDVGGPVAVDDDRDALVRKRGQEFAAQRVIVPAGDVRRPDLARLRVTDAGNGDTYGNEFELPDVDSGQEQGEFVADQFADGTTLPACEWRDVLAEDPAFGCEQRAGKLGAAQVDSDDGRVGHEL